MSHSSARRYQSVAGAAATLLLVPLMAMGCDSGATHESQGPRARTGVAPAKADAPQAGPVAREVVPELAPAPAPETIKGIATPAEIGRVSTLIFRALGNNDAATMKSFLVSKEFFTADRTRKALGMGPGGSALSQEDAAAMWEAMAVTSGEAVESLVKDFGGTALEVAEVRVGAVEMHGELRLYRSIVVVVRDNAQATTDLRFMGSIVEDTVSGDYFILGFLPINKDGTLKARGAAPSP